MIHIATVHWATDKWIAIQERYLRLHIASPYRVYAWLNDIPGADLDSFYYVCCESVKSHAVKLNLLADLILSSSQRDDDILIFLDGDAFPIGDIEPFVREKLTEHKLIAVQRLENNGDPQPHPSFCATTVGFWRSLKGDWKRGYQWLSADGDLVTDVGANLLKQLSDNGANWLPLRRSNDRNLHPVFFGVYGNLIYHHGAGFRNGQTRADWANQKMQSGSLMRWATLLPYYKNKLVRKQRLQAKADIRRLSETVFTSIQTNPEFYGEFMVPTE